MSRHSWMALPSALIATALMLSPGCKSEDKSCCDKPGHHAGRGGGEAGGSAPSAELKLVSPTPKKAVAAPEVGTLDDGVGIPVGTVVPEFSALGLDGTPVTSAELTKAGPVLLVFYRGGWCPYCNFQVRSLANAYSKFEALGVTPVLISVDRPDGGSVTKRAYTVPFPLLSDQDLLVHEAFKVTHKLTDTELSRLKNAGIDVSRWADRPHGTIGVPAAFLLDGDHTVKFAHAVRNYRQRPSADQLLAATRRALGKDTAQAEP